MKEQEQNIDCADVVEKRLKEMHGSSVMHAARAHNPQQEKSDITPEVDKHIHRIKRGLKEYDKKTLPFGNDNISPLMIILAILFCAGIILVARSGIHGYASLSEAEVFAGKPFYEVGETAHLFVLPTEAKHTIEVYDPDNNIVAQELNFVIEKAGTYDVRITLMLENETGEMRTSFEAVVPAVVPESQNVTQRLENASSESQSAQEMLNFTITPPDTGENITAAAENLSDIGAGNTPNISETLNLSGTLNLTADLNLTGILDNTNLTNTSINSSLIINKTLLLNETLLNLTAPPISIQNRYIKNITVKFIASDMNEKEEKDKGRNVNVVNMSKDGVKISIKGAKKDKIKNVKFENRIIHVDSVPIEEAIIELPIEMLPTVIVAPKLMRRDDNQTMFSLVEPYEKNNKMYDVIEVKEGYLSFTVEHFTDYYVNTSGDYDTLEACLIAQNNTANACIVNRAINENFTTASKFYFTGYIIQLSDNSVNNTYIDFNNSIFHGDDGSDDSGIDFVGGASDDSVHNSTIKNVGFVNVALPLMMDNIAVAGQRFVLSNFNASSMTGFSSFGYINSHNSTVKDINIFDGTNTGFIFFAFSDSNVSNVVISNLSTYGFYLAYGTSNAFFSFINISNIMIVDGTSYGMYFPNEGDNDNVTNSSFSLINGTGIYWSNVNSDIKDSLFENNTLEGLYLRHNTGGVLNVFNNTFRYNDHEANKYLASYSRTNVSGTLMNGGVMVVLSSVLGVLGIIDFDDSDVSAGFDGVSNFSRWSLHAPGAGLVNRTFYVQMGYVTSCASAATTYGGTCYGYQDDYWVANGDNNYTINPVFLSNSSISIIQGDVSPAYVKAINKKSRGDIFVDNTGLLLNVSGNNFIDKDYYSEDDVRFISYAASAKTDLWLNNFYYNANLSGMDGTVNYCRNNVGNFLTDTLTYPFGIGECGVTNITYPAGGEVFSSETITANWTAQSSQNAISYYLYYSTNAGSVWNYIAEVSAMAYSWTISGLTVGTYLFKAVPHDQFFNASNKASDNFDILASVILNASSAYNSTGDNLTAWNMTTVNYAITNIYAWQINGIPYSWLMMPFNTNVSNDNASRRIRDYSGYGNNATLGSGVSANIPIWNASCKVGGCYDFDDTDDVINASITGLN
ncbi:MAG TPA: hypothetical protein VJI75_04905, partial [Candidatus Nanoarchaeia archaeon]|nr:hypothetical protein [Candidatus Nanoarchaeia archaeon]